MLSASTKLATLSDEDLVLLRARLRAEMHKRGLADSVGAVGEQLAIEHFRKTPGLPKLQMAPHGTKNVDALSRNGDRFSIKTVCEGSKTGTIYPEPGDREKQLFEYILIVKLADDWSLQSIHQLAWSDFVKVRSWDKRMNAWYAAFSARSLGAANLIFKAGLTDNG
ncbi:MAG: hypothetical protein JXA71_00995 [Chitinispirillaceae bacterium]|nr:hypothetical protein [Chitinispirillaceae bacterium]